MAGIEPEKQFQEEMLDLKRQMLKFVEVANQKFDGLASDLRGNSFRIDKLEHKIDGLDAKIDGIDTKLDLVAGKVIDHEVRLRDIEEESPASSNVN